MITQTTYERDANGAMLRVVIEKNQTGSVVSKTVTVVQSYDSDYAKAAKFLADNEAVQTSYSYLPKKDQVTKTRTIIFFSYRDGKQKSITETTVIPKTITGPFGKSIGENPEWTEGKATALRTIDTKGGRTVVLPSGVTAVGARQLEVIQAAAEGRKTQQELEQALEELEELREEGKIIDFDPSPTPPLLPAWAKMAGIGLLALGVGYVILKR